MIRCSNGPVRVTVEPGCRSYSSAWADPSARRDLEMFFDKLVPENTPWFSHTLEGADDMPSHIRMALTRTSETIPVHDGRMVLGTWQGIFLFEHRSAPHHREVFLTVLGE